ncbi:hypothetical protein [Colwellia sp. E2M01]|uniref:hypothetical protein n=1 Tax=Colwellia sp. E2M01 TaxID=2841561 RepID=UPI001C0895A0|nr:hypothetical protein [Colwellia sp. E2M01]MBU2869752.1 hypothetical protein [Colwellia sp. E2M01]
MSSINGLKLIYQGCQSLMLNDGEIIQAVKPTQAYSVKEVPAKVIAYSVKEVPAKVIADNHINNGVNNVINFTGYKKKQYGYIV